MDKPTVGRIVHFYPGKGEFAYKLPNGMEFAPAIVTQVFDGSGPINLTVFVMPRPDQGIDAPVMNAWSVVHADMKSVTTDGNSVSPYWEWPPRN